MHYEVHDSSGTPLLLLHGGPFDTSVSTIRVGLSVFDIVAPRQLRGISLHIGTVGRDCASPTSPPPLRIPSQ